MQTITCDLVITWYQVANSESVSSETLITCAHGDVVSDKTIGVKTARSKTWIHTLIFYASLFSAAIIVEDAFRPTAVVWITMILGDTSTLAIITDGIGATRTFIQYRLRSLKTITISKYFTNVKL